MKQEHFTENEIYELSRTHTLSKQLPHHLQECDSCMQEFTQVSALFSKMKEELQSSPHNDIWFRIETQRRLKQQERKQRLQNWSFASVAASLLLVIGLQWNVLNQDRDIQNQIQAAIIQSQQLEKSMLTQQHMQRASYDTSRKIAAEISEIDEDLQQAYHDNESQTVILNLWSKRISTLKRLMTPSKYPENIEVI